MTYYHTTYILFIIRRHTKENAGSVFFVKLQAILLRLYWCKMFETFSEQQSFRIPWRTVLDTLRYHIKVQWHSG